MWLLINTVSAKTDGVWSLLLALGLVACPAEISSAQTAVLRPPASVVAGHSFSISTGGDGAATFYLLGPSQVSRQQIKLGHDISIRAEDVSTAGRYLAITCSQRCQSVPFWVTPSEPAGLSFLVHPSRVPVQTAGSVSGVAVPFDRFQNQVLAPITVDFKFSVGSSEVASHSVATQNGVAWFQTTSSRIAQPGQMVASAGDIHIRRVVQQVASDPCSLRIRAQRTAKGIVVETEPVRDCFGNPIPDGTIITFMKTDAHGKSTVDAPIKAGVARAQMTGFGNAVISAASGLVMGNPIQVAP